jgi:adenosine deaminase
MYVDLHVHLRGTISPPTARKLAKRNGIALPPDLLEAPGYGWNDFASFLRTYDLVASVVSTASDIEEVAYEHLITAAGDGAGYLEFMLSTPHETRRGLPYADQIAAIDAAADRALEETGIECRIVATAVRHLGPDAAVEAARIVTAINSERLVGFGLTGDELQFHIALFREAFAIARQEGMKTTAHAGEHLGPETILEAVEVLSLDRVGHGVTAVDSPQVLHRLAALGIPLEVCITSNLGLGVFPDLARHPAGLLADAGCVVTLGTDDPTFFCTSASKEYALASGLRSDLLARDRVSLNAITAAFCDEVTKAKLRDRLAIHQSSALEALTRSDGQSSADADR